jgi:hypothetical protein
MKLTKLTTQAQLDKAIALSERETEHLFSEPFRDDIPERFDKVHDKLGELENKYFELVWYSRKLVWYSRKDYEDLHANDQFSIMTAMGEIKTKYPKEIAEIEDPEHGVWKRAFNNGVLASLRLAMGLMEKKFDEFQEVPETLEEAMQLELYVNEEGIAGDIYEEWDDALAQFPELDT